jgi:tryptophanase
MELVRLAIPRRVYTQSHIDYVVEVVLDVWSRRDRIGGFRITRQPATLRHFTAEFEPLYEPAHTRSAITSEERAVRRE